MLKDILREISVWEEVGNKKIKYLEERMDKLEKGLCNMQEVWKRDIGVGNMEEGSKRIGSGGENKVGKNNVRGEHNGVGGGRSYRRAVISMKGLSKTSKVFSDREVRAIKRMVLDHEKRKKRDKITIKRVKIEGRVEKE